MEKTYNKEAERIADLVRNGVFPEFMIEEIIRLKGSIPSYKTGEVAEFIKDMLERR